MSEWLEGGLFQGDKLEGDALTARNATGSNVLSGRFAAEVDQISAVGLVLTTGLDRFSIRLASTVPSPGTAFMLLSPLALLHRRRR